MGQTIYAITTLGEIRCAAQRRSPLQATMCRRPGRAGAAVAAGSQRAVLAPRDRGLAATGTTGRGPRPSPTRALPRAVPRRPADRVDDPSIKRPVTLPATAAEPSR